MTTGISSLFSSSEINLLVSQLESRLDAPITVAQDEVKTDQAEISALGAVQSALSSLGSALSKIADPSAIDAMQAMVSNSNATASAAASAVSGSYALSNIVLAKPQELLSALYASGSAEIGGGAGALTFTFAGGGSTTVEVASGDASMSGIANAINAADLGVSASVIETGSGAYLSLSGGQTGTNGAFGVSGTGSLAGLSYSASGSGSTLHLTQTARNASFELNGARVVEPANSELAVVKGLSINLAASGSATITVGASSQALSSALSNFATQFNNALSVLAKETEYKAASAASGEASGTAEAGPLLGDVQVEQLSQAMLSTIASAAGSGVSAAAIGLALGSAGSLTFSSAALASAYAKNPAAVNKLVQTIEQSMSAVVTGAIGSGGTYGSGAIGAESGNLQSTITSLDQQISAQQALAAEQVASLEQAFTVAETKFGSASTTLDYLSATLGTNGSGG